MSPRQALRSTRPDFCEAILPWTLKLAVLTVLALVVTGLVFVLGQAPTELFEEDTRLAHTSLEEVQSSLKEVKALVQSLPVAPRRQAVDHEDVEKSIITLQEQLHKLAVKQEEAVQLQAAANEQDTLEASVGSLREQLNELTALQEQAVQLQAAAVKQDDTKNSVGALRELLNKLTAMQEATVRLQEAVDEQPKDQQAGAWYDSVPLDVVFAWYNHTDPERQALYKKLNPEGKSFGTEPQRGEIFLGIASVHQYAPWVDRIWVIVPAGQTLRLDLFAPELQAKVRCVKDEEFVPDEYLPNFSSLALEAFLHLIPGLSEHFLYMNDDFQLGRSLPREVVFSDRPGVLRVFMRDWGTTLRVRPSNRGWAQLWQWPFYNAAQLYKREFHVRPKWGWHSGYLLTKTGYNATWALYGSELTQTASHRFRQYKSLATGGDIVPHLLVQSVSMHLGLQEVHPGCPVGWKGPDQLDLDACPGEKVTFLGSDSKELSGLPEGVFQAHPGGPGVTFVNFNKLQHLPDAVFKRLCESAVRILQPAYAASKLGCMCAAREIGIVCNRS